MSEPAIAAIREALIQYDVGTRGRFDDMALAVYTAAAPLIRQATADEIEAAKDRVWQVVQALRDQAQAQTGDPYGDPVAQALSAALVGHEDFPSLLAKIARRVGGGGGGGQ